MSSLSKRRKAYDRSLRTLLYLCAGITCALLLFLIGYIFYRGLGNISWELLSSQTSYINNTIGILPNLSQYPLYHSAGHGHCPPSGGGCGHLLDGVCHQPEGGGRPLSLPRRPSPGFPPLSLV